MFKDTWTTIKFVLNVLKNPAKTTDNLLDRFFRVRGISSKIIPEYRFKWPQMGWWDNTSFNQYLDRFNELENMNTDRRWMLYQLMRLVENIPGDTAECGAYQGASSYLICKINAANTLHTKQHYIFDSFAGLSEPLLIDGKHWQQGDLSCSAEIVNHNLSEFENYTIYQGWIPARFNEVEDKNFSCVHIDVDLYQPTKDSLEFFYTRTNEGGIIICDDYGFTSCPGATKAFDDFLADKQEKMLALSCGGGFFIKGLKTGNSSFQ